MVYLQFVEDMIFEDDGQKKVVGSKLCESRVKNEPKATMRQRVYPIDVILNH